MAAEQDEHRNKRARAGEETGSPSSVSITGSTPSGNIQPGSYTLPRGPLSNTSFAFNSHDSGGQASYHLTDDDLDSSSSKDERVALPIRDKAERDSTASTNMNLNDDADMMDATSVVEDEDNDRMNPSERDYQSDEDRVGQRSSPKGKGRALSISEDSSPEVSIGARNRSNRVIQSVETDMDMDSSGSDHSGSDNLSSHNSGSDHSRDEDHTDEGSDGDGSIGRYDAVVQFQPPATVDPPVQEFRVNEDGTVDVRAEDAGAEDPGQDGSADG